MATAPWFVLSPNALLSTVGLLRGPDKTVPTPAEDWQAAVATAKAAYGHVDGLVNNAGILRFNALVDTPLEEFMEVVRVNQTGCFLGVRTVAPELADGGTIVNTAS